MINPVILFVPVSSDKGVGEYTRSLIIANAVQQKLPEAQIHFILNKNMKLADGCQYQTHFSKFSATKDTPLVNETIAKIRPNIVIFDCAGRSQQFATAKRYGAKVVFISQHRKKRARGLTLRRLLFCDLQWVVQPNYAIQPLNRFEQLKLKILRKKPPKNIGPIVPKINSDSNILEEYSLKEEQYALFSAGSGGHVINGELAADIFYRAALKLAEKVDCKIVMVFGANYPKSLPVDSSIVCISHIPTEDFLALLKKARHRVLSAGSTLLQVIELKLVSLAIAISKDQPSRLKQCSKLGLVLKSKCDETAIVEGSLKLFEESTNRDIKNNLKAVEPTLGIAEVLSDIGRLLGLDIENGLKKMSSVSQKNNSYNKIPKKYLFFISQDYSFPVLRPIQNQIIERGDQVKWFLFGDELHENNLKNNEIRLGSVSDIIQYNPDAVFVPGNVVPSFIPGLKIQVFHGLPSTKAKKNGQLYHYIIRGMFDLYCTQGPESTEKFNQLKSRYKHFQVAETGWSKLDPLFEDVNIGRCKKKPTIFFASTFSPRFSKAKELYPLLIDMMKKYDFQWYVTLHPKMDREIHKLYSSIDLHNVKFVESTELIECFKNSDLMLCDTSSIIYEFLTQLKPVVTFQTEKVEECLINITEINKLEDAILHVINDLSLNSKNIAKSVDRFHPYTDGQSSNRILDNVELMLSGKNLPLKKKPMNIIRNFKMRRELGYWRF